MFNNLFSKYLVKTSKDYFLYIHINDKGYITWDKFNKSNILLESKILLKESVIDFSIDFNNSDIIYLLYLTKNGELKYGKIINGNISSNTIAKLDLLSNIYSNLKLIIYKSSTHIFYSYQNYINSKVWTIQHIIGNEGNWKKAAVISISSGRTIKPFYVYFDKFENIHLIYEALEKKQQNIYYISYTQFFQKWNRTPYKLSENFLNSDQSYLFIDSKDNIHVLWCSTCKNNNTLVQYRQSPSLGKFQHKWKTIQLPIKENNCTHPIMFEETGILKIIYKSNYSIKFLYSQDYGYTWKLSKDITCSYDTVVPIPYLCYSKIHNTRINSIYAIITDKILLFGTSIAYLQDKDDTEINVNNTVTTDSKKDTLIDINNNTNKLEYDNQAIQDFIKKTENELENIMLYIKPYSIKKEIESIIKENAKLLDENIKYSKNIASQTSKSLKSIESLIKYYTNYLKQIDNMLNYLKENYKSNILDTQQILSQINQLNDLIEDNKNKSILQKFIDFLK